MIRTFSSIAVIAALGILTPIQAQAFGLGKLELSSALNEPFKAEIPVTAMREDEHGNLQVRLATTKEFARAGIERSYYLTQLEFTVVEISGITKIEVRSQQPIKEPFVDFLLTATTGEGRLIREYTVLLDPPKTMFVKPAKTPAPVKQQATSQQPVAPKSEPKPASNTTSYGGYQAPSTNTYSSDSYGPTGKDDTLWDIALKTKPSDSTTVHQMMMALFDANPHAFIKNNINNLKSGQTLAVPSADVVSQISNSRAVARAAEQYEEWKNAKNNVVAESNSVASEVAPESQTSTNNSADASLEQSADARLQLIVANDEATSESDLSPMGDDELSQLKTQLTLAQETIESQEQETVDFKSRMDAMEEQLEIMRRIITVKDSDLARLQGMLGGDEVADLATDEALEELEDQLENVTETEEELADESELVESGEELSTETLEDMGVVSDDEALDSEAEMLVDEVMDNVEIDDVEIDDVETVIEDLTDNTALEELAETEVNDTSIEEVIEGIDTDAIESEPEELMEDEIVAANSEVADYFAAIENGEIYDPTQGQYSDGEAESTIEEEPAVVDSAVNAVEENPIIYTQIKSFIAENKTAILTALGALFLGLVAWLIGRRRSQEEEYEWVDTDSLEEASESEVEVAVADSATTEVVEPSEELLNTAEVLAATTAEDEENATELLNRAEMSILSGEYGEAHALVEQARNLTPDNQVVKLKLIALAYYQKQTDKFNDLADSVDLDESSAEWKEIDIWRKELESENALIVEDLDSNLNEVLESNDNEEIEPDALTIDDDNDEGVIEFDLGDAVEEKEAALEETLSFDSDFDLEVSNTDETDTNEFTLNIDDDDSLELEDSSLVLDSQDEQNDLDVVLEVDEASDDEELILSTDLEPEAESEATANEDALAFAADNAAEELDIGADDLDFDMGNFDEIDEAETKLDLAAAYIDMGDPSGAKNILNEVISEGNEDQQSRAKELLNSLA